MVSKKVLLPEGVQDLLIDDCIYRRKIENQLSSYFMKSGYMEVSSPTLEYYDLFSYEYLSKYGDKMFKLIDTNGSLMVLRPDCTIPIARMVATKMKDFIYPLKLCYIQNVFRMDQEQSGRKREYRQAGVELFGVESLNADVEVIITAIESLLELGLKDFQIEIGQIKIIKHLLRNINLPEEKEEKILLAMANKNLILLEREVDALEIDEATAIILKKLPTLFGDVDKVLEEVELLPLNKDMKAAVVELKSVCNIIKECGYGSFITVDFGMVAHLGYYTGITFKGYTKELGAVVLSGGRYNKLMETYGMECPATGFAIIVNKVTKALKLQGCQVKKAEKHYLIVAPQSKYKEAFQLSAELRKSGNIVEISLLDKGEEGDYCSRRNVDEVIYIDHEDKKLVEAL
ncbi:ATP phosphoribosyltransferase regulatory subunit [Alkaliphilus peptidifermentans]|uniref:ATP phosphoribosyltransferase regulatory subunit n=1 Tax=Alkaliphilus peptidifermentans DSM 18978 TaxID=1120976 RepID=A0A1G5ADC4_9FIRM|nr:ATP phosphoribosyltransferase regulatory subunit [Alkaliphilus peptidifermentans]SCX75882.1 ATP phosphoribosyltransferase regulatory subunit [Alkaliphilus peptidifermentans DSM 18978]